MGKLKLLIDRHGERVVFAEADKESVDLLFHLLSLPVATLINLLPAQPNSKGSLTRLYESIKNLDDKYIQAGLSKDKLLSLEPADRFLVCTKCCQKVKKEPLGCDDEGGLVKGLASYMVMDDLEVTPLSTISILSLLNKFQVRDLKEEHVDFGAAEAAKLFITSLKSRKVLTEVYLKGG